MFPSRDGNKMTAQTGSYLAESLISKSTANFTIHFWKRHICAADRISSPQYDFAGLYTEKLQIGQLWS